MILFKIGDETPFIDFNECLKIQHDQYRKNVDEIIKERAATNVLNETEIEGQTFEPVPEFEPEERYKRLKIAVRMTSADDYYSVSAKISALQSAFLDGSKRTEQEKIDMNLQVRATQREFLKKSLVGIKGFQNLTGEEIKLTNTYEDILAIDGALMLGDVFSICQFYQGLSSEEKKRLILSQASI